MEGFKGSPKLVPRYAERRQPCDLFLQYEERVKSTRQCHRIPKNLICWDFTARVKYLAFQGPTETHQYNCAVMYGKFQGRLQLPPMMPRDASLWNSCASDHKYFSRPVVLYIAPGLPGISAVAREASVSRHHRYLINGHETFRTTLQCRAEWYKGSPFLGPHYAERRESWELSMKKKPESGKTWTSTDFIV